MFLHVNRTGKHEHLRILGTYCEKGKHKQRVVASFGRLYNILGDLAGLPTTSQ